MDQDYFNPDQVNNPQQDMYQQAPQQGYVQDPNYVPPQDQMYMQQPYMQQPYMQQMPPQMPPQRMSNEISPEDNHKANMYCVASLLCTFVIPLVTMMVSGILVNVFGSVDNDTTTSLLSSAVSTISGLSHLAGWVLMIITRVRFPKNKFGKVLMIVYLSLLALVVIGIVVLIISCIKCLQDCPQ